MSEDDFLDNGFVCPIADYVADVSEEGRIEDIDWLRVYTNKIFEFLQEDGQFRIRLLPNGKHKYFKPKFKTYESIFNAMTIDDFCNDMKIRQLQTLMDNKFSFYFCEDGVCQTFDSFIRDMHEGEDYYIGGVLDYHW